MNRKSVKYIDMEGSLAPHERRVEEHLARLNLIDERKREAKMKRQEQKRKREEEERRLRELANSNENPYESMEGTFLANDIGPPVNP